MNGRQPCHLGGGKLTMPMKNIKNCVLTKKSEKNLISRRDPQQENIIIIVVMMDNNYYFSVDTSKFHHVYDC
jgi:hypothetical protein